MNGEVRIAGAKNAALPILAATLLAEGRSVIGNVPHLQDITTTMELLGRMGVSLTVDERMRVEVDAGSINQFAAPYELVKTMRASILVLGPLLARFGQADVSLPGGCAIGSRPVNLHINGLRAMGADVGVENGYIRARGERLRGARLVMDLVTVTGTENLMMAACFSKGVSVIENAASDPEIFDFANFLIKMGGKIHGLGTRTLTVEGVGALNPVEYYAMNDRLDAGLFMMAAGIAGGEVSIIGVAPQDMRILIEKMMQMGVEIRINGHVMDVSSPGKNLRPVNVLTCPYPGFATDFQPAIMALSCIADGQSYIRERIFDKRFSQVAELRKLGASIDLDEEDGLAIINGPTVFRGAETAPDNIRAASCILLAGLACPEKTTISNVYQLNRGHFDIENRFQQLGADVKRIKA